MNEKCEAPNCDNPSVALFPDATEPPRLWRACAVHAEVVRATTPTATEPEEGKR